MQYTIEARQLTNATADGPLHRTVEAKNPDEAISKFVKDDQCELVSFTENVGRRESIATVKKENSVFLVRVYPE